MGTVWKVRLKGLLLPLSWLIQLTHGVFGLCFNRYTAALLLLLMVGDIWLETRGVPAVVEGLVRQQLRDSEVSFEFQWMRAGLANGIVLEGVTGEVLSPVGPVRVSAQTLTCRPDWLDALTGHVLLRSVSFTGGSVKVLDGEGKPSAIISDLFAKAHLSGDDTLTVAVSGMSQGLQWNGQGHFSDARRVLRTLLESESPKRDLRVHPDWQAQVASLFRSFAGSFPPGNGSSVNLDFSGSLSNPMEWRVSGTVICLNAQWKGVEIPRLSCGLSGNMDRVDLDDIRLSLTSLDSFGGAVTLYPRLGQIEGSCQGHFNGWTAMRVYEAFRGTQGLTDRVRTQLAWILRLPVSVDMRLERSGFSLESLRLQVACGVTGAELPVLGRSTGQVSAHLEKGEVIVEDMSLEFEEREEERLSLQGRVSLLTGECSGDVEGIFGLERLFRKLDLQLPGSVVKLSPRPCEIKMHLKKDGLSQGWRIRGALTQRRLRLLDVACRSLTIPFAYSGGSVSVSGVRADCRGHRPLLQLDASCDLNAYLREGSVTVKLDRLQLMGNGTDDREWRESLSCRGEVVCSPSKSSVGFMVEGSLMPDLLYRNYLKKHNIDSSHMLTHIDCRGSDRPMRFSLKLPVFSIDGSDWTLQGNFSMGGLVFNGLSLKSLSCSDFTLTPDHCLFQHIRSETSRGERIGLDLRVDYAPFKMTFSRGDLQGDPRIVSYFFMDSTLRETYLSIFKGIVWSPNQRPRMRLPKLVYQGEENWSLHCEGIHIQAKNVSYQKLQVDDLNAVIGMELPHNVTLETLSIKKDDWWLGGRMELELQGVRQCRFQVYDTLYGTDLRYLIDGLAPDLAERLKDISVSPDCVASCRGSFFLDGEPRLRMDGKLKAQDISFGMHGLKNVNMDWSYDAGNISWEVLDAKYLTGNVKTSGLYNMWEEQGKILLRFKDVPLHDINQQFSDISEADVSETRHYKGNLAGELQVEVLHGWAGRDWHLNGNGHIAIRDAELWNVPLLSSLSKVLKSATFGWLSSGYGQISELDADVELLGAQIHVPRLTTNGTIISLMGSGEYRWTDDWKQGDLHFLINGIPVKGVKILSFMLSSLTGMFQAELKGSLQENHWSMRTFIDMIF